jgi:uncharacterized delta-60 repeat protein
LTAKVTPSNGTAGDADYRFKPGAIDGTFNPGGSGPGASVSDITFQPDGKILVGGGFSTYNGAIRSGVARLHADGSLDTTFAPPISSGSVACLAVQPDGKVLVGGNLSHGSDSAPRTGITRLNANGTTDASFNPGTGAGTEQVSHVAVQPDGKIIIGGFFTSYNGVARKGLARLNPDGNLDATFNPGAGPLGEFGTVYSMLLQPDGKLLVGGAFLRFDWADRDGLVRLNPDGTVDTTFEPHNPTERFFVYGLALQPDGKVVAGGGFYDYINFNGANPTAVTRYNADGSADNTFKDPGLGTRVLTQFIALQPDGKLVIGGNRLAAQGGLRYHSLYRLNPDGTKDATFDDAGIAAHSHGGTADAALQPDGRIIVGGTFATNPSDPFDTRHLLRLDGDIFVNWAAGDAADKTVNLPVFNDTLNEEDETVHLAVTTLAAGAAAGAIPSATLTIVDDDPLLQFGSASYGVGENAGSVSVPVARVGATARQSTVNYSVTAGTAAHGSDFTAASGTLTFAPGETSKNISVPIVDDAVNELDETFELNLSGVTGGQLGRARASVTIQNDDPLPTISVNDVTITETDSGVATAHFTVTRTGLIDRTVSVIMRPVDGTALAGEDYDPIDYHVSIGSAGTSASVPVFVLGDTNPEQDERFYVNLTDPVNVTVARGQGAADVKDNETNTGAPTVQLGARQFKGSEGAGLVAVTVTRTGDSSAAAAVIYSTNPAAGAGAASERSDYTFATGTLRFAPGETSKTFNLFVTDDAHVEGDELFSVSLNSATGAGLGTPTVSSVRITDNDATPSAANPADDTAFFVRQHYRDFLGRDPDAPGFAFWTGEVDGCGTDLQCREVKRVNVSAAFFLSIEFQETGYFDYLLYQAAFGTGERLQFRTFLSDSGQIGQDVVVGAEGWEEKLASNKQAFADAFVARANFETAFPQTLTAAQFVDALNANTGDPLNPGAGGSLTQGERDALVNGLAAGALSRAQVLRSIAEHREFRRRQLSRAFVLMQYFGYLRREPNAAPDFDFNGYHFWLNKLNEFKGNFIQAEMVKAFITAPEYRQRFGQ